MKNKVILKRKCMEISLYNPNIFHLGQEVMFTKHTLFFKTNEKVFYLGSLIYPAPGPHKIFTSLKLIQYNLKEDITSYIKIKAL